MVLIKIQFDTDMALNLTLIQTKGPDLDPNSLILIQTNGPGLDPLILTNSSDLDTISLTLIWS